MRAVVQRVSRASVTVEGRTVGAIDEPADMKVSLVNDGPVTIIVDL